MADTQLPSLDESCINQISGEKWDNMTDATKKFISILIPSFYKATGVKVYLTSGWRETGPNGPSHHTEGTAFDVAGDDLNDVSLRNKYGEMAKAMGGTPLDEYYNAGVEGSEWWDGNYWGTTGDNFHVTVTDQSGNYGDGSNAGGGPKLDEKSQKIQNFINIAVKIANEEPHHYVYGAAGPTDFDCTGYLSWCLNQAGFDIEPCHGDAFDSGVMACGFEHIDYSDSEGYDNLKPGDILSNPNHVELYIGNGQVTGAHSAHKPDADQISVEPWYGDGWAEIYRYPGVSGVNGPNGNGFTKGGGAFGKLTDAANAFMNNIKTIGNIVILLPVKKTYCESVYPDYVYVAGNIPCSPIEKTMVEKSEDMDTVGDYNLATSQDMHDLTGIDSNSFTGNKAMEQAQRAFDPTNCQLEVKVPNAGKPLNNNDPFPVDLKIEELERHLPRVKQYSMPFDLHAPVTKSIAAGVLHVSDYAEKRIVRLENNMATLMRYVFALGSRLAVNCVYYGGQDHRSWNLAA